MDKNFNLQNTLTRYEEAYHSKIEVSNEEPVEEIVGDEIATIHDNNLKVSEDIFLTTDWYFKKSAIDHIVSKETSTLDFCHNSFHELSDFTNQPFELIKSTENSLQLQRNGGIYLDKKYDTKIKKEYKFIGNTITLDIAVDVQYNEPLQYIQEWNLHFASLENLTFNGKLIAEQLKTEPYNIKTNSLEIYDSYLEKTLIFTTSKEIEIVICTLDSVSQSEQGVDLTNQGLTFGFIYPFTNKEQNSLQLEIR